MNPVRRALAVLVAALVLGAAPAAYAGVDYSKNAAGGDYAPAVTPPAEAAAADADEAFDWGDAAIGAGAALVLVLAAGTLRRARRREPIGAS